MNKIWIVVIGAVFAAIILISIFYISSDFDRSLVQSVKEGKSSDSLILLINQEQSKEIENAKKHLNSNIYDMEHWNKTGVDPSKDEEMDLDFYNQQVQSIDNCTQLRKSYVNGTISESQFLENIQEYKFMLN
ncbi:MAG: hypothetical protein F8N15_06615 [Methanobacterium sp.]|nr:hypothetical protein [Methanobacterium sp.]